MDNSVIRERLIYVLEQLQTERGGDFSGCEALRLAIMKFTPEGHTVLNDNDICLFCGAHLYLVDVDNGNYNYCPNCGRRIIRRD